MMKGMAMGKMTKNDGGSDKVDNEDDDDNQIQTFVQYMELSSSLASVLLS